MFVVSWTGHSASWIEFSDSGADHSTSAMAGRFSGVVVVLLGRGHRGSVPSMSFGRLRGARLRLTAATGEREVRVPAGADAATNSQKASGSTIPCASANTDQ